MKSSHSRKGTHAFEAHYSALFGDRWPALRASMLAPEREQYRLKTDGARPYQMDAASVLVASAVVQLHTTEGGALRILDLCAAPGGKTLVLALSSESDWSIVANDRSAARRGRLRRVLDEHLGSGRRERVTVCGHDARRWGLHEQDSYDLVLADVPCSSEAHLLTGSGDLTQWSESRIKRIANEQFAMLRSASQAVRPGGLVVYATCSLAPEENERLIEKAIIRSRSKGPMIEVTELSGERTLELQQQFNLDLTPADPGYRIWPDYNHGAGPMYFCILKRSDC